MTPQGTTDVAWIGIGSNVGSRTQALDRLRSELQRDSVVLLRASAEILTRAVGLTAQADFHNQVVVLRSPEPWTPERWLQHCKDAETRAGRRETYHWGPRVADADILLLGERGEVHVDTDQLTVPHHELPNRPFWQRLLAEVDAPGQIGSRSAS